jgi:hypothetical protein
VEVGAILIGLRRLFSSLEELDQPVHQAAAATDHMQSALVLMFFEDFVEIFFAFSHCGLFLE